MVYTRDMPENAAPTTAPTTCDKAGCSEPQEVGIRSSFGEWRKCTEHATEQLDQLNPNRKPGRAHSFAL